MKTIKNQGFLTTPNDMGRSVPVKTPHAFRIANEIKGFEHVSYGTALTNLHLYNRFGKDDEWRARIKGKYFAGDNIELIFSIFFGYSSSPTLGASSASFDGYIAEMMVFNRALSPDEQDSLGVYLNQKYAFMTNVPATPTGLEAIVLSSSQILVRLKTTNGDPTTSYKIERKLGAGGTEYYYRVWGWNYAGESGNSSAVSATTLTTGTSIPVSDADLWYQADSLLAINALTNGAPVEAWHDNLARGRNAATYISGAAYAVFVTNVVNGKPSVRPLQLYLPKFIGALPEAEFYAVLKAV